MLYSIIGILVIILDQLVKLWVDSNIHEGNVIESRKFSVSFAYRMTVPHSVSSAAEVQGSGSSPSQPFLPFLWFWPWLPILCLADSVAGAWF